MNYITPKLLVVLVNYGEEQLCYLETVVKQLKSFRKYNVYIIVQSNIPIICSYIDKVNILELEDYQLLPLTCREEIWNRKDDFDVFVYGENDHLFKELHIDNHIQYSKILPINRIAGLIQFEENEKGRYYPGYHFDFEWDYSSVEIHGGKVFAHFSNVHQATFILTREQLLKVGDEFNFKELVEPKPNNLAIKIIRKIKIFLKLKIKRQNIYSKKCKVNTDVYNFGSMKKMICISEFESNLIHHLPNLYIDGIKGRNKFRSDSIKMDNALKKLLKGYDQ